ncbi:hypothetical protein GO986_18680 [Deinococcus sp. HMF7620]|uniref:DUF3168 domain-containing protein n=1 Tax=Deinococcus arboris TaxID=2682977 RepID=A0A7C9I1A2_9DEIO|nr:hypothetical protein [Deinococcus arboris]MVN88768.1 hypothetical protein [Deinococcus arboris]
MTLDQLLDDFGVVLARDEAAQVVSHMVPNPLPPTGTIYAVTSETEGSPVQGHGFQERQRLVLVMLYGAAPTAAGKRTLDLLLAHLKARAKEIDRHPTLRLRQGGASPADTMPTRYDSATRTHYAGQRFALTYLHRT